MNSITRDDEGEVETFSIKKYLKAENFIIPHDATWKGILDTAVLIVTAYSCVTAVCYTAYKFSPKNNSFFYWIDNCITLLFCLDFFLRFF